mgnify:CR=1 FL=1
MVEREPEIPVRPDPPTLVGPVRTCVGCRERDTRRELLRVVAGSDARGGATVVPDPDNRLPGRGAHLHPRRACLDLATRRKAFGRALRLASAPTTDLLVAHLDAQTDPDGPTRNWSTSS